MATRFVKGILKPYAIVFRHVLMKPHTIKYPYERLKFSDGFRGRISLDIDACISCRLCAKICPTKAVRMVPVERREKVFPEIDFGRCSFCELCVEICPKNCLKMNEIVELSVSSRKDLVYSPEELTETPLIEEVLKDLKRKLLVKIEDNKISYVVEGEAKK